jgi:hypothetical protein
VLHTLPALDLALWAATSLGGLFLFCLILRQHLDREFPFLALYLGANLIQTVAQLFVYQFYGFESNLTYVAVWSSQAVIVVARALATCEFCHRVLGPYRGVWALAMRILLVCGAVILGLTLAFSRDGFQYRVMTLEIASEAFIATIVVGTVLFARHYDAQMGQSVLLLGLGFGLNSCLKIVNDAVLSRYWRNYSGTWNEVAMAGFAGALVLWVFAMRAATTEYISQPELRPAEVYRVLAPQMNRRLAELNDQLVNLLKAEQPKL